MKKSLNDSLREEFASILAEPEYSQMISDRKLDDKMIKGAFDKLLSGDRFLEAHTDNIDKTRSEFENYILNDLKTKRH